MPPFACSGERVRDLSCTIRPATGSRPRATSSDGASRGSGGMDRMTPARESAPREQAVLPQAHRTIRLLDSAEGPFRGALVTSPDGPVVRVEAESLAGWAGCRYAGTQHIAAPVDMIRRADGHDVLLPWCTERLEAYVDRRLRRGGLPSGEVSTVVVSLLRGLAELGPASAVDMHGTWWLTDGGRPVFVLGPGQDAPTAVLVIVDRLRAECTDKTMARVLDRTRDRVRSAAAQRRVPRRLLEDAESDLLEIAAPRPLEEAAEDRAAPTEAGVSGAVRRVRTEPVTRARLRERRMREESAVKGGSVRAFAGLLALRDRVVSGARPLLDRRTIRVRPPAGGGETGSRRRRVLIVAGACAAAVLLAGLLWPSDGDDPAVGAAGSTPPSADRPEGAGPARRTAPTPAPSPSASAAPPKADDPTGALPALLAQIVECEARDDAVCAAAVAAGSAGITPVAAEMAGRKDAVLVDRYGDMAVMELPSSPESGEAKTEEAAILVLVWADEKWLVRDAYRVADQPK
ncbi:conserved protein of unknown function [Microbacterium sp. Nx66]|nr:conserved protein of unknown function [Microbacterium sp. Nx66]